MSEKILETCGLCKRYGNVLAVDHVDMQVDKGQIYGLVGKNGAGKTTLMKMITAQALPSGGGIALFGATGEKNLRKMRCRMGAVVETPSFYPFLSARQNLEYYRVQRGLAGRDCVEEALEMVDLTDTKRKKFKDFSLGMKQRLGLALAVMGCPDFLLLDEPINGLDPMGIVQFRKILLRLNEEKETTILISSHILSELSNLATCYGFIERGKLIQQIQAKELEESCREYLELVVDEAPRAATALEAKLNCREFDVLPEGKICVYQFLDQPARVTGALAEAGVNIYSINTHAANLEEYFLSLIQQS